MKSLNLSFWMGGLVHWQKFRTEGFDLDGDVLHYLVFKSVQIIPNFEGEV